MPFAKTQSGDFSARATARHCFVCPGDSHFCLGSQELPWPDKPQLVKLLDLLGMSNEGMTDGIEIMEKLCHKGKAMSHRDSFRFLT
jgi:hypothetical protein